MLFGIGLVCSRGFSPSDSQQSRPHLSPFEEPVPSDHLMSHEAVSPRTLGQLQRMRPRSSKQHSSKKQSAPIPLVLRLGPHTRTQSSIHQRRSQRQRTSGNSLWHVDAEERHTTVRLSSPGDPSSEHAYARALKHQRLLQTTDAMPTLCQILVCMSLRGRSGQLVVISADGTDPPPTQPLDASTTKHIGALRQPDMHIPAMGIAGSAFRLTRVSAPQRPKDLLSSRRSISDTSGVLVCIVTGPSKLARPCYTCVTKQRLSFLVRSRVPW